MYHILKYQVGIPYDKRRKHHDLYLMNYLMSITNTTTSPLLPLEAIDTHISLTHIIPTHCNDQKIEKNCF